PYSIRNATLKNFEGRHTKAHATDSVFSRNPTKI
ncbi:hypothetical protein T4A_10352, partial [Trichinella pseudospiralis]